MQHRQTKKFSKKRNGRIKNMEVQKLLNLIIKNEENLKRSLPILKKGKKQIQKGVFIGKNVKIEPNIFFDTEDGEIVIGDKTTIKAFSVLRGPLSIGKNCIVNSFAEISHSQIGDVCKIGGEVKGSIISEYSNKQHHGTLCYSYIGKWVNIGAGTNISDLKNTYNFIKLVGKDTGQQFLGCIIGDYCKVAINTSIFCGKVIGVSSHLYGTVVTDVPSFVSHIKSGVFYEIPLTIAEKIQTAMATRRGVKFTEQDHKNFETLFNQTAPERRKLKVKKGKLSFK